MKLRSYLIELDGKAFQCHGYLEDDSTWSFDSLYIGQEEVDDWLEFLSDYCQSLVLRLGAICYRRALADDFSDSIDHSQIRLAA